MTQKINLIYMFCINKALAVMWDQLQGLPQVGGRIWDLKNSITVVKGSGMLGKHWKVWIKMKLCRMLNILLWKFVIRLELIVLILCKNNGKKIWNCVNIFGQSKLSKLKSIWIVILKKIFPKISANLLIQLMKIKSMKKIILKP